MAVYRRPLNQVEKSRPCYALTTDYVHQQCNNDPERKVCRERSCCTSKPLICPECHPDFIWCKITEETRRAKEKNIRSTFHPFIGRSTTILPPPLTFDRSPFWRRRSSIGETEKHNLGVVLSPFRNRNSEHENYRRSYHSINVLAQGKKQKRNRTAFTPTQLLGLEKAFEKGQYLVGDERRSLSLFLNLSETQIKVWFQNRRTKWKRLKENDRQMEENNEQERMNTEDEYNEDVEMDQKMSSPYIDVVTMHNGM